MRLPHLILGCTLALLALSPAPAKHAPAKQTAAERTVKARPALWVVRDADTTIYLFGTIHLLKRNISWFDGPVRSAYDEAQQVVLEVAEDDKAAAQADLVAQAIETEKPPLSTRLPGDYGAKYLAALEQAGLSRDYFEKVKPWFATFTLTVMPLRLLGYDPESGADRLIELSARKEGKMLTGLETAAEQIGFFSALPEALQIELLGETLDEMPTLSRTIEQMIAAWTAGDPERLSVLMNDSVSSDPELEKRLLTDRNAHWADWIKARMDQPGTVFIAVGAGHLAGKASVQEMLGARGLAVQRVKAGK